MWLDVELFEFDKIEKMMDLEAFTFAERVNVRTTSRLKATVKDVYKSSEILQMTRPIGVVNKDGYAWCEYTSSKGAKSAVAIYDAAANEFWEGSQ